MPNKTIYIRESEKELWEKAESMAGSSLSGLLTDLLKDYISSQEEKTKKMDDSEMERIVLEIGLNHETRRKVAFQGRVIASHGQDTAYYTPKGYIIVHRDFGINGEDYEKYERFEDMRDETDRNGEPLYDPEFLAEIANEIAEDYVEELDV